MSFKIFLNSRFRLVFKSSSNLSLLSCYYPFITMLAFQFQTMARLIKNASKSKTKALNGGLENQDQPPV